MRLVVRMRSAISSTRAPAYPRSANSRVATSSISLRVRSGSRWRSGAAASVTRPILRGEGLSAAILGTNVPVRTFLRGGGVIENGTHLVGLIGTGIGASLSPALHEREAARQGLAYEYRLLD